MKVKEMSKPKRDKRTEPVADERLLEPQFTITEPPTEPTVMTGTDIPEPLTIKPRRYTPPPCSCCTALRPAGKDFTEVYRTTREAGYVFRYCKCGFCGNTFKDSEKILSSATQAMIEQARHQVDAQSK